MAKTCKTCGQPIQSKPRSTPQHRRLFGLLKKAYNQWPESASYHPTDAEDLRAYLLIKAGWYDMQTVVGDRPVAVSGRSIVHLEGRVARVFTPKSTAYGKMSHQDACWVYSNVEEVIESTIGVSADKLLEMEAA